MAGWVAVGVAAPFAWGLAFGRDAGYVGIAMSVAALLRARDQALRPEVELTDTELVATWPRGRRERVPYADIRSALVARRSRVVLGLVGGELVVGPLPPGELGDLTGRPTPAHRLAADLRRRAGLPAAEPPRWAWGRLALYVVLVAGGVALLAQR